MTGEREPILILLRAINVGGHNKVPMARLRELFELAGATRVSTYIASGNLLCVPPPRFEAIEVDAYCREVQDAIAREFSVVTTAIPRTLSELVAARRAFPFDAHDNKLCAISFLESTPSRPAVAKLAEQDFGGDTCAVIGRELHLHYAAAVNGSTMTPAKLTRILGTPGTARNLGTVDKLVELMVPAGTG